jgi:hypothetical protein
MARTLGAIRTRPSRGFSVLKRHLPLRRPRRRDARTGNLRVRRTCGLAGRRGHQIIHVPHQKAGIEIALHEGRVGQDLLLKGNRGHGADDDALGERAAHARDSLRAVFAPDQDLA